MTTIAHFTKIYGHRFLDMTGKILDYPQDNETVQEYLDKGFESASVYESPEGDFVEIDNCIGYGFHKIGFIILEPEILFI